MNIIQVKGQPVLAGTPYLTTQDNNNNNNNNNRFAALCPGLPGLAGTRRNTHPPTIMIIN